MMSHEEIIGEVATITGVPAPAITGRRRTLAVSRARWLAIAAIRGADSSATFMQLGALFRRHHTAIIKATHGHRKLLKTDPNYQALARQVCLSIFYGPATSR